MPAFDVMNATIKGINRLLPQLFNGNAASIGTSAPANTEAVAMGKAGQDGVVTLAMDSGESGAHVITAWVWSGKAAQWFKLGQTTKSFGVSTIDGIVVPRNAVIFLTSADYVVKAWTDMEASRTNPNDLPNNSGYQV
jgi:hypothetical protein